MSNKLKSITLDGVTKEVVSETIIQSDWNQTDSTKPDYIKNKPNLSDFLTCATLPDCRGYFTGVNDITLDVGDAFDPRAGVLAYNSLDEPIPFVAIPSSVDTSTEGVYQVVYIANGTDPVVRTVTVQAAQPTVEPFFGVFEYYEYVSKGNYISEWFYDMTPSEIIAMLNSLEDGQTIRMEWLPEGASESVVREVHFNESTSPDGSASKSNCAGGDCPAYVFKIAYQELWVYVGSPVFSIEGYGEKLKIDFIFST